MHTGNQREAKASIQRDKSRHLGDIIWRFRLGVREVVVRARDVGAEVEVCTESILDEDDVKTLGRARFKRSTHLVLHLLATKEEFLANGWVSVESPISTPATSDAAA